MHILMQWGRDESTLKIKLVHTHAMHNTCTSHTSILQLHLEDEVTPEVGMMATLWIEHDLPAPTLVLEHVKFRCNRLLPRGHLRQY